MVDQLAETDFFGFTRVGEGESISKNGYAFGDGDQLVKDRLFKALEMHSHDGDLALTNPTVAPGLTPVSSSGSLPAATIFYYKASFIDKYGLETAASPEATVTTQAQMSAPSPPTYAVEATGGSVLGGSYGYSISFLTASGGETTPSTTLEVAVTTGTSNRIRLDLPALPTGATRYNVYRRRPGQGSYYYLGTTTAGPFYDAGEVEDTTVTSPVFNTTNNNSSVTITIPTGSVPDKVYGWKIYRTTTPGTYDSFSLVHHVVEPTTEFGSDLRTSWTDTGDVLQEGSPKVRSSVLSGGVAFSLSDLEGEIPMAATARGSRVLSITAHGTVTSAKVYSKTHIPAAIKPSRLTAFFQSLPTGLTSGATPSEVIFTVADAAATPNSIQLVCADNSGYYEATYQSVEAAHYEAETGLRSNVSAVPIANDGSASNGQAVELNATGEYVEIDCGVLDAGTYRFYSTLRVVSGTATDMTLEAIDTSSNAVLGTTSLVTGTQATTTYAEKTGPSFTAPGGVAIKIRARKNSATANTYLIDKFRWQATGLVTLAAGVITVSASLINAPTPGGDVQLALWF